MIKVTLKTIAVGAILLSIGLGERSARAQSPKTAYASMAALD